MSLINEKNKMKKKLTLFLIAFISLTAMKNDKPAYQFFDTKGKKATYGDLLKDAVEADVILFGELHNNPVCHWMQLELTTDLHNEMKERLVMGAEMFEADDQIILDEYLTGRIKESNFKDEAKLWKNYQTDYRPLVEFARENNVPFIATNIPRRYAAVVNKEGFEGLSTLSPDAKRHIAPLPIPYDPDLEGYKSMLEMMGDMGGHGDSNLPKAQAAKDATMAWFILQNWKAGKVFIHYNGTYHSNNFEGIAWYLKNRYPDLRIVTIASVEQADTENLTEENSGLADYTLCIPERMTKTY